MIKKLKILLIIFFIYSNNEHDHLEQEKDLLLNGEEGLFFKTFKGKDKLTQDEVFEFILKNASKINYNEVQNILNKKKDQLTNEEQEFLEEYTILKNVFSRKFKNGKIYDKKEVRKFYFSKEFDDAIDSYIKDIELNKSVKESEKEDEKKYEM